MEENEYDSDNTVLLTDYNDKPKEHDAKRRRLSSLHDRVHALKYEDENTVPGDPSDNTRTDSPPTKQKSNTDKNLHIIKYLAGLDGINIKNNKAVDFRIAPAPINLSKQKSKESNSYKGDTLKRATNFVNQDVIICIESDDEDETQNYEKQNEDVNHAAVIKVYGNDNKLTVNKYGKLTVLKPSAINARRATSNVIEQTKFPSNRDDSVRLDENKQPKVRVLKPSVINARRATTSFEGNFNTINNTIAASKSNIKNKKLITLPPDVNFVTEKEKTKKTARDCTTPKNYEPPKSSSNATKEESFNMAGSSEKNEVANTNTAVSIASENLLKRKIEDSNNPSNLSVNANPNKLFSHEDKAPITTSKRVRTDTVIFDIEIATHKLTAKLDENQIEEKSNESNKNENQNNTHSETKKTEVHAERGTSLKILNPKTFEAVNKEIISEGNNEQKLIETCDMQGTNNVKNAQESIRVHNEQVINKSHDKQQKIEVERRQEVCAVQDQQVIRESNDKYETCKILEEQIINKAHNDQERSKDDESNKIHDMQESSKMQDNQITSEKQRSKLQDEIREIHDIQVTSKVQDKHIISKTHKEQQRSTIQDNEVGQVREMQETNSVHDKHLLIMYDKQMISKTHKEQESGKVQGDEISQINYMQERNNIHDKQIISKPDKEQESSKVQYDEISKIQDKPETSKIQSKQIISKQHNEQERSKIQNDDNSRVIKKKETSKVNDKLIICKLYNDHETSKIEDDISKTHDMQEKCEVQDKQIMKPHIETERSKVKDNEIREIYFMQQTTKAQDKQIINKPHEKKEKNKVHDEISKINDIREKKKVQGKQTRREVQYKQATEKVNDVQEQSQANNELGKIKRSEITRKVGPSVLKKSLLKFQVQFFTLIKEYIKKDHPESSMSLHNLIQTLKNDARNGNVHTDIKYGCPQCGHVSIYSASLQNEADYENKATADDFQKCSLCQGFTKLHTSYMIRYLEEVTANNEAKSHVENTVKTSVQETVASNSQALSSKKSVEVNLDSNLPVPTNNLASESPASKCLSENIFDGSINKSHDKTDIEMRICKEISLEKITVSKEDYTGEKNKISYVDDEVLPKNDLITRKVLCNERTMDRKRKKIDAERNSAQNDNNLTNLNVSPFKDTGSTSISNLQNDIIENNNEVPAVTSTITQGNIKLSDKRPNKVIILSVQNITPRIEFNGNERHDSCFKVNNRNISQETQVNRDTLTNNIMRVVSRKSDDGYLKYAGKSGSNSEPKLNHTVYDESPNENTPKKAANNLQTISCNINVNGSSIKSKSNSLAAAKTATTGEDNGEMESKTVTENAKKRIDGLTNETVSDKFDDKEIRNVTNEVEGNDPSKETNKLSDDISINTTSERSQTVTDSNSNVTTTSKEKDTTDENNLKALKDCFIKLKNNINTKEKEVIKAKVQQEPNIEVKVSASNRDNSFVKQPKRANDQYICPVCSCEYVRPAKLLNHMRNNHNLTLTNIPKNCVRRKCVFCNAPHIINYNAHLIKYHHEKFTDGKNESNKRDSDNNSKGDLSLNSSRYKYHCSICDEILSNHYTCRQHRKQKHPDLKKQQIYKKVIIEYKEKIHQGDNEELNAATATSTIRTEIEVRTRSEVNNDKQVRASQSRTTSSELKSFRDISSDGEEVTSTGNSDEDLRDNEDSSDNDDKSMCTDNGHVTSDTSDRENESDGKELEETYNNNMKCTKHVYLCKLCKATFSSYKVSRKHRVEKHPHMSGTQLFKRIPNDATNNCRNSERKESRQLPRNCNLSSCDDEEIEDHIDKSALRSYHEKEVNSDEEAVKASDHTLKKKEKDDNDASARTKINEEKSNQEPERKQSSDKLFKGNKDDVASELILGTDFKTSNEKDPSVYDQEKLAGDDKNIKKLFYDKNKNSETNIINENYDQQHTEIENTNAESGSNCFEGQVASEDKRVNVSDIQISETDRDQEVITSTINAINLKPTNDESSTKELQIREKELGGESCENEMHYQEKNTENSGKKNVGDSDEVTVSSELVINEQNKISASNTGETKVHDDDQTEIDMINCFLEELNSQPNERIENICDDRSIDEQAIGDNNGKIQDKNENHTSNLSHEVKTCLENIKITNVTSIANKIYIYICQECHYATDDYDTVIRHCQNHYNKIEDPVINCQSCQIKYDAACFERHKVSHVRYLNSAKIKFSYKWLYTNWQAVFENMLLRDAEDIQVKSIYKTFCVKMAVKEDGPWQTSLYLCGKCNTCVAHQDIEKHVQQKCCFMNFPCSVCHCAFLTYDMRKHHEIYHEVDKSTRFKIIVFNDKLDESFNLKLSQAKAVAQNGEKQSVIDIFKCLCGLCFVWLKNFKLHFVECEEQANNGVDCPDCIVLRRFLPTELDDHRSLHHGTEKYDFRVQQIAFQEETNHYNSSEAVFNSSDTETNNGSLTEVEDRNINRDTLKGRHEMSTQTTNDDSQKDPEANKEDLAVERDILRDEILTQNTNDNASQRVSEANECNEKDISFDTDILKDERLTQNTNDNGSQGDPQANELNKEGMAVNMDTLKDQTLSQSTNEIVGQRGPESVEFTEEDIAVKREMLKDETLTQSTNKNDSQSDQKFAELNHNEDLAAIEELSTQEIMDVDEYEPAIPVDDSDYDSDIQLIED